jgi:hypothetical protein
MLINRDIPTISKLLGKGLHINAEIGHPSNGITIASGEDANIISGSNPTDRNVISKKGPRG